MVVMVIMVVVVVVVVMLVVVLATAVILMVVVVVLAAVIVVILLLAVAVATANTSSLPVLPLLQFFIPFMDMLCTCPGFISSACCTGQTASNIHMPYVLQVTGNVG